MKKLIYSLAIFSVFACSSDDDTVPEVEVPELKTEQELLVEGSPWEYESVEVIEVVTNAATPKTDEEIEAMVDNSFPGFEFSFAENGTGSITTPDGNSYSFNYEIEGDDITFEGNAYGTMENFDVTEDELKYTVLQATGDGENPENDVEFYGRFTYN